MKRLIAVFVILMMAATVQAATLAPMPRLYFRNAAGTSPLSFGKVYSYEPGTSTPKATYTDSSGDTENTNPVILSSDGGAAFFLSGCYDLSVTTSAGVPLYTTSNVCEYEEATSSGALILQWNALGITPIFLSTTSFSTVGDYTDVFEPGLRLKSTTTAGTIYSTVVSAVYAATVTTVTVVNDSGVLDSGLSEVQISVLTVANPSAPIVPVLTKTTGYTILPSDCGKTIIANVTSAATFTLPAASAVPSNCTITTKSTGTGALTLSGSIDGFSSMVVSSASTTTSQYGSTTVKSSGSAWFLQTIGLPDENGSIRSASTTASPYVIPITDSTGHLSSTFTTFFPGDILGLSNVIVSGFTGSGSASLAMTIVGGTAYVDGNRVVKPDSDADLTKTYTASKDTYVDLTSSGTMTYTEVANGAAAPDIVSDSIRIGKAVTGGSNITSWSDYRIMSGLMQLPSLSSTTLASTSATEQTGVIGYFSVGDYIFVSGYAKVTSTAPTYGGIVTLSSAGTASFFILGNVGTTAIAGLPLTSATVAQGSYHYMVYISAAGTLNFQSVVLGDGSAPSYVNNMGWIIVRRQSVKY